MEFFPRGLVTNNSTMKEDSIGETSSAGLFSEKNRNDQRSIVCNMVHFVALGLPSVVAWLAQPGSSELL